MPDPVEIRHVPLAEMELFDRAIRTTFLEGLGNTSLHALRAPGWVPERAWGALSEGRYVGTLRTIEYRLSLPGSGISAPGAAASMCPEVTVDGLTAVTVAATHHRQGILRRMITDSLCAAHERGDALSILVAAEWAIYGRFGYSPAATWASRSLSPRRPGARLRGPVTGRVRQVDIAQARQLAPAIFDVVRTQRAGHIDRDAASWDRRLDPTYRAAGLSEPTAIVHEGADGPDGLLVWRPISEFGWVEGGRIQVEELFATDQAAYNALWGYLLDLDVVDEIVLDSRPPDEPLSLLMVDGRSVQTTSLVDAMWVRLLDVPAALAARGYATSGRLCLDVVDEDTGGYAAGRYLLEAAPGGSTCRRAPEETPDLQLSQRALAAVYLGQPSLRAQHSAGLVDELEPGALARADLLFGTPLLPWVGTGF